MTLFQDILISFCILCQVYVNLTLAGRSRTTKKRLDNIEIILKTMDPNLKFPKQQTVFQKLKTTVKVIME
jgi:hypothetical protein